MGLVFLANFFYGSGDGTFAFVESTVIACGGSDSGNSGSGRWQKGDI
jgi:hypothetical protein